MRSRRLLAVSAVVAATGGILAGVSAYRRNKLAEFVNELKKIRQTYSVALQILAHAGIPNEVARETFRELGSRLWLTTSLGVTSVSTNASDPLTLSVYITGEPGFLRSLPARLLAAEPLILRTEYITTGDDRESDSLRIDLDVCLPELERVLQNKLA